jgi:hypothetical protein
MQPIPYKRLRLGQAFSFLQDGAIYVRCRSGYRQGRGGPVVRFNYQDCPVFLWG